MVTDWSTVVSHLHTNEWHVTKVKPRYTISMASQCSYTTEHFGGGVVTGLLVPLPDIQNNIEYKFTIQYFTEQTVVLTIIYSLWNDLKYYSLLQVTTECRYVIHFHVTWLLMIAEWTVENSVQRLQYFTLWWWLSWLPSSAHIGNICHVLHVKRTTVISQQVR